MSDLDKKMAFPGTNIEDQSRQSGLTKREYFTAKAMQAYASSKSYDCASYDTIAEYAVKLADKVLAELEKSK